MVSMQKYVVVTPDYTATFIGHSPADGGFIPDLNTGQPARDEKGLPVIACHEVEISFDDAGRLRLLFDEHMGAEHFSVKAYRWFLGRYLALDDGLVEELVLLERIRRLRK
jgi:hypothetical protein